MPSSAEISVVETFGSPKRLKSSSVVSRMRSAVRRGFFSAGRGAWPWGRVGRAQLTSTAGPVHRATPMRRGTGRLPTIAPSMPAISFSERRQDVRLAARRRARPRRRELRDRAGRVLRPARPERRRQDDADQHPRRPGARQLGQRLGARPRRRRPTTRRRGASSASCRRSWCSIRSSPCARRCASRAAISACTATTPGSTSCSPTSASPTRPTPTCASSRAA